MSPRRAATVWEEVRDALAGRIAGGEWRVGARLPSEHALATRFAVSRLTIRRALAALAEAGTVQLRPGGGGALVTAGRIDYPIHAGTRFADNIAALGMTPEETLLGLSTAPSDDATRHALGLAEGEAVHLAEFLRSADGMPVAYGAHILPAAALPGFPKALERTGSVAAALADCGLPVVRRRWTRLSAAMPAPLVARRLSMMPGQPALLSRSLKVDGDDRPVEYCESWVCGPRVEMVVS